MNDRLEALHAAKKAHGETLAGLIPTNHKCGPIQCSAEQWDALQEASDAEKAARAGLVPTEQDAINLMFECYQRLRELGWNNAIYCPKDGSEFDAIEAGSTGIHRAHYSGEWPNGHWFITEDGDLWPSRPILYRVSEEEKARWKKGAKALRGLIASGTSGSAQDAQRLDPKGAGPIRRGTPLPDNSTSSREGE